MVNDKMKLRQNDEEGGAAAGRREGGGDLDGGGKSVGDDNCNANLAKRKDVMMGSDSEIMTIVNKQTRALNINQSNNTNNNGNNNSNNNNRNKNNAKFNSNSNSNSNSGARTSQNKNGVKSNNVKKSNASKNANRSTGSSNRASVSGNKNNNSNNGSGEKSNVSDNKKPQLLSWRIPLPVNDDNPTVNSRNRDIKRDEKFIRDLQNTDKNSTTATTTTIANLATDMVSTNVSPTTTTTAITNGTTTAITTSCVKCAPQNAFNVSGPYSYSRVFRGGKQYHLPKISDHPNSTNSKQQQNRSNSNYSTATTTTTTNKQLGDNNNNNSRYFKKDNMQKNPNLTKFMPIPLPLKPIKSCSDIDMVTAGVNGLVIFEKTGNGRRSYPLMQSGTLEVPETFCRQRLSRMDSLQIDDGFHSDGGTETPPLSPSSGGSITSDHGSYENVVDTSPGAQRLAVLSYEQCRKLNDVMNESVAIHGHGNFPVLEVKLKDLVNLVRRKLETDLQSGGAGMVVKDIRLNGGAASHVLASEDQQYNDLDLIFAVDIGSSRHFDRVKTAVLNVLMDLLPEGVSRRRITPCSLKEAYVGKMVKVNNNLDGDRWSLISLGNSPGHKNVELKFVDTMRRQFEFSVDSFQIVLDSLMLFYDCTTLPISENFYPTVVGESVYGDFQEALYHLQKKLISTRQPEEIRGGGLLKYCNLLVRNYKAVNEEKIKNLERYMCSRFFIDFPDYSIQRNKLEAYLRNHFWGIEEEPLQYQYLMHLREVVEMSTVCLMNHERRQTIQLIQSLAMQVLCREQQKQYQAAQAALDEYQEQHSTSADNTNLQHQQSSQSNHQQQHQQQQQQQQLMCTSSTPSCCEQPNQTQTTQQTNVPQTIQIQPGPPGLIYANGVYYAPVISTTICTCNSTWLST